MSILVTGGAGYIGSHAVLELLNSGYKVIVIDNLSNSRYESINRVKKLTNREFLFYQIDLLDEYSLEKIFAEHEITSVMHFAGLKAVNESITKPINYYRNNVVASINLFTVMKKYNVKKIIFSSSATVYGKAGEVPISELSSLNVINPYGRSKLIIEDILKDISISDSDWGIAILRYFNPVGAHESGQIGENPINTPNNLMPYITQVAIGNVDKLRVFGDDYETMDGTGVRDYIHVVDLVKGHIKALQYLSKNKGIEVFNLGTGTGFSVLEIINTFKDVNSVSVPYEISKRREGDIGICYANPEKAEKILGWKAEKDLKEMCESAWEWQYNNPYGF